MTPQQLTLAGALVGVSLVCATVLAALHVVPGDVVVHLFSVTLGGALGYLTPSAKAVP